jgi:hypothetical protein
MDNFIQFATTYPVGILSLPICLLAFYWSLSLLGLVDLDFDFDLDFDTGPFSFAGLGQVPLAVGLTIWFTFSWIILSACVFYVSPIVPLDRENYLMIGLELLYVPISLVMTMPLTKWCAGKLSPIFKITEGVKNHELVGCKGIVISPSINDQFGDVEVTKEGGYKMRIKAVTHIEESFEKGDKIIVVDYNEDESQYIVTKSNI